MAHGGTQSPAVAQSLAALQSQAEVVQSKRDLTSWWKNFKRGNAGKLHDDKEPQGIFGVPLQTSIRYANVAISLFNDQGHSYIYGYVPIVVAKCGVFLKEKATDVEGIFRLSGSEKRIKELRLAFDSPDRYGKGLDWSGYTVHDAANILRRYFNQLPEPIIPLDFYERFREPLKNHQAQAVGHMELQGPELGHFDAGAAIRAYQNLITELPPLNRQLLLYILDLLAVFASKSDLNKMTTPNLAAIFQPGILSHPQHDMSPSEYRLSQDVLIFLIENQDHFLIGMHGTAADEKTVQEVQSGAHTPAKSPSSPGTPGRSKTIVGRTSSNASAGADSLRKFGGIRRNMSVSSKNSKQSTGGPTPVTPTQFSSPNTTSSVYRSNTVPSKRSARSPRFPHEKTSDPPTPTPRQQPFVDTNVAAATTREASDESTPVATVRVAEPAVMAPVEITSASSSEATTPLAAPASETSSARQLLPNEHQTPSKNSTSALAPPSTIRREPSAERSSSGTPSTRGILDMFKSAPPGSEGERLDERKPRKLQKKKIPGASLSSAQSSAHSLRQGSESTDEQHLVSPITPNYESQSADYLADHAEPHSVYATAHASPRNTTPQRTHTDSTLRPAASPAPSYRSHRSHTDVTDTSDAEHTDTTQASTDRPERKSKWRFSRSANLSRDASTIEQKPNLGTLSGADHSKSTISSGGGTAVRPRQSFQQQEGYSSPGTGGTDPESVLSDSEQSQKKGPIAWVRGKIAERKERSDRARSPNKMQGDNNESRQSLALRGPDERGKSLDMRRGAGGEESGQSIDVQRQQNDALAQLEGSRIASEKTSSTDPVKDH